MSVSEAPNYKDTLNLPQTDFPMKGNLPVAEPGFIQRWKDQQIYQKMVEKNKGGPSFVMPDGPPYANGNIHLGHVLNKVLKDIVIKYKNMSGHTAAFIPGWDCHGLPIELKVTQKLGKEKASPEEIRSKCRAEALSWVETQKGQFQRLGVLADWDHPYLTLQPQYEADEVRVLAQILRNGILFRGEKPVYWCPTLQTALAAAEVEFQEIKSPSIYVKFYVEKDRAKLGLGDKPVAFVIWTTTPWTLPANHAIALNADLDYAAYDAEEEFFIIAKGRKEEVEKEAQISLKEVKSFKGRDLEHMVAKHPFLNRDSLVILGDHVTLEAGTGAVHTAPGHGLEDYHVGLKYKLPVTSPVGPSGLFTEEAGKYSGLHIWKANPIIIEDLKASGHLLAQKEVTHSYAHNPRSKTPLIFRATPQWFIRMDDSKFPLRKMALEAAESKIQFVPKWGSQRLTSMLSNSPDWCLSRQRYWGVPIPVFYCQQCGHELAKPEIMVRVADKMESTQLGIEAFHQTPVKEFIGDEKCEKCGSQNFTRGQDILDVWFDSGVCHTAVQKRREGMKFPADIYLEGSDQHRGWFQTSLVSSLAAYKEPPFKALITHGFVNDEQGYKMSKSKGNVTDPAEIWQKNGAEILRLWVAYEDYGQDVNVGGQIFQRITETYRRIRNTMRFLLGNLGDFDPRKDMVEFSQMPPLDQWALLRLNELNQKAIDAYDNYDFYKVYHALNNFFTVDLSATYLDILKDRLYTWKKDGLHRRASQTVMYHCLTRVIGIMAPILSFLAEEAYHFLPGDKLESVFLTDFPRPQSEWKSDRLAEDFEIIFDVRSQITKELEELRRQKVIGASLDAKVKVKASGRQYDVLKAYEPWLKEIFIVSHLELESGEFQIETDRAGGEKCPRCWHYSFEIGTHPKWPGVCPKCAEAL